ncbi:MAG TPA: cysteine--tRNA ligase, partial [Firmicutes bacterium]|nr:cysteine--tRNA ligase [Bacillota bacterium]
ALSVLEELGDLLGIWFAAEPQEKEVSAEQVKELVQKREEARANKDFKTADWIRDSLKKQGIILEDTPQGVRWRRGDS